MLLKLSCLWKWLDLSLINQMVTPERFWNSQHVPVVVLNISGSLWMGWK